MSFQLLVEGAEERLFVCCRRGVYAVGWVAVEGGWLVVWLVRG